jgi:2-polyprenyl-3-methyl-5-hydroxy-6-metoxy-1,4-benzoquinol methylase
MMYRGAHREYLRCQHCGLIFVPKKALLPPEEEKARYDLHNNHINDPGYQNFLQQLCQPLIEHIGPPPQRGLDFGCGPGPALAHMLASQGYKMDLYDPNYEPHPEVLKKNYDFVTCTEVMEHLYQPAREWKILLGLVKSGGWLGIMTKLIEDPAAFPKMHYIQDATHVSFYSRATFKFLAKRSALDVKFVGDNVILLHKPLETAMVIK